MEDLFQSTRPARGATIEPSKLAIAPLVISIHAPREGRDWLLVLILCFLLYFNPRAPRGARRETKEICVQFQHISIHAPREGRDLPRSANHFAILPFQSTRPARGATSVSVSVGLPILIFQSTRPARGATSTSVVIVCRSMYFNPRAPRGARQRGAGVLVGLFVISIHAPREGRDGKEHTVTLDYDQFQSTRPARGATNAADHSEHAGRDFNPRAPRGARPRATVSVGQFTKISIHAPREGRDSKSEQISLHIFAKKAWIPDIFAQNAAFQSVLPLADRQKLLYLRCEPLRKFLRAFASHYKIIGSSGR